MSFYTDEQLSMILSATASENYWNDILNNLEEDDNYNPINKQLANQCLDEVDNLDEWAYNILGVDHSWFFGNNPTSLLRRLQKYGLA